MRNMRISPGHAAKPQEKQQKHSRKNRTYGTRGRSVQKYGKTETRKGGFVVDIFQFSASAVNFRKTCLASILAYRLQRCSWNQLGGLCVDNGIQQVVPLHTGIALKTLWLASLALCSNNRPEFGKGHLQHMFHGDRFTTGPGHFATSTPPVEVTTI